MNRHPLWERILRSRPSIEALEDRLLLSHTPLAPEFVVNTNLVAGTVAPPAVATASDATGDFVVVWTNAISGTGTVYQVFAQRYNRHGLPQGGEPLVSPSPVFAPSSGNGAVTVDVSTDATGDFVVVYDASNGNGSDQIFAHLYAADGTDRGQIVVNPTNDPTFNFSALPSVASDSAGDFVVAFTTTDSRFIKDVYARQFNASGTALGAPIKVSTDQTIALTGPSVGSDGAGNFVVAWNGQNPNGNIAIVGRRFSSGGVALDAAPFVVSQTDQLSSTPDVSVARDTGSFVITWDINPNLGTGASVLARRYDATGQAQGSEFVVNTDPLNFTAPPHVAVDADGDFAIVWATGQRSTSMFLRTYLPDGTAEGPQMKVNSFTGALGPNDVATDDCGNLVVGWTGFITNSPNTKILARICRSSEDCNPMQPTLTPPPTPTPTPTPTPVPTPPPPVVMPPSLPSDPDPALVIALARAAVVAPAARAFEPFLFLGFTPPSAVVVPTAGSRVSLDPYLTPGTVGTEPLGEISGRVFEDLNGNGIQDPGEPSLPGQIVFLDLNDNGIPDEGEPIMKTDMDGKYLFSGLALTRYKVRQDLRVFRMRQTAPLNNQPYVVDLTPQNNSIADKDFGVRVLSVTGGTKTRPKVPPPDASPASEEPQGPPPKEGSTPQE